MPKSDLVFVHFDNGVWSKLPSGKYVEKTKREEPTAEFSTNPVKFGKAILKWDAESFKSHQQAYELIPQEKPQANKPLSILVLHNGKPVQGIKVGVSEDAPFNLTNEKGIAQFTPTKGFNKVWAEFEENVTNNADYDRRTVEYMLTFDAQ
ncbi:Nickel uptake substrate-specific transmembrane region [Haemophilus influenzae]|nr:Nickel uptake substrate-specific transmembrane region [Haemophilus influenzae]